MATSSNNGKQTLSEDAVHRQVELIAASKGFAQAQRLQRFLRFIVEEQLAGRIDNIQEYVVGLEVFDRKESFDPRVDSVVRVQGGRLRERLAAYYATEGADDPIRITLARRGYVPVIEPRKLAVSRKLPRAIGLLALFPVLFLLWFLLEPVLRRNPTPDARSEISIGVIPFQDYSPDSSQEYFADGVTDALISELARAELLRVISRTTMMRYRRQPSTIPEIADELDLDYAIEGGVVREGDQIRITVQLIDARQEGHVWAHDFAGELSSILALQREIATAVARELRVQLTGGEAASVHPEAYDLYLKARAAWHTWTVEGSQAGMGFLRQAIELDPEFALAHAWLAQTTRMRAIQADLPAAEILEETGRRARKAVEIDPDLAFARSVLAVNLAFQWKWEETKREFLRAIEIEPNDAMTRHAYANFYLSPTGRFEEAATEMRRAIALDPANAVHYVIFGTVLTLDHSPECVDTLEEAISLNPTFPDAHRFLSECYVVLGRPEEAIEAAERAQKIAPNPFGLGMLARAYGAAGQRDDVMRLIGQLKAGPQGRPLSPLALAFAHLAIEDHDEAAHWFEQSRQIHEMRAMWLAVWPGVEALRTHPGFRSTIEKMGLLEVLDRPQPTNAPGASL